MLVTLSGMTTLDKPAHPKNAILPMLYAVSGSCEEQIPNGILPSSPATADGREQPP